MGLLGLVAALVLEEISKVLSNWNYIVFTLKYTQIHVINKR